MFVFIFKYTYLGLKTMKSLYQSQNVVVPKLVPSPHPSPFSPAPPLLLTVLEVSAVGSPSPRTLLPHTGVWFISSLHADAGQSSHRESLPDTST